jgi:hypothetical protein
LEEEVEGIKGMWWKVLLMFATEEEDEPRRLGVLLNCSNSKCFPLSSNMFATTSFFKLSYNA